MTESKAGTVKEKCKVASPCRGQVRPCGCHFSVLTNSSARAMERFICSIKREISS
jgi:hypothetical protein